jgi:CBS domain-containing protein
MSIWGALVLIKDLMRRNVGAVQPETPLGIAARRMRDDDVGCLPVLERGRLLGLITDRDIVTRAVAADAHVERATVRDVMSAGAVFCFADQTADEAQRLMLDHQVNRLPVLDRRNRLVGLVSLGDIAGQRPKCRPHEVRFYKTVTTSSGHARDVAVATVYLSPAVSKEELAAAAIRRFEQDRGGSPWGEHADGYEVVGPE